MEAGAPYELAPEDRKRLVAFLWRLRDLLGFLVLARRDLISPPIARLLEEAWEELERERRLEQVVYQVEAGEWDRELINHGLYGAQLALKLGIFDRAGEEVSREEKRRFQRSKRRRGIFKWALKAGNVVLGSLADAVPGGAVIREFKEAAETALDERLPWRQRITSSVLRWRGGRWTQTGAPPDEAAPL